MLRASSGDSLQRVASAILHIQSRGAAGLRRYGRDGGRLHVGGSSFALGGALRFDICGILSAQQLSPALS